MDEKKINDTSENVKNSVYSIYSSLLERRRVQREEKEEQRRIDKEEKRVDKQLNPEDRPMTKKEKRVAELDSWKEVIIGLTGDDLDYISPKKNKKKYKKWLSDDADANVILTAKPEKKKKRNYNKEFEPELNMLKSIVTDQNRFTVDLLKRYQNAAGPNTKDSMPLNKTLVELAAVINNSRSNSLGVLREIGNIKKTIADLYMKQKKLDSELGGGNFDNDLGLVGSSLASSIFDPRGDNIVSSAPTYTSPTFGMGVTSPIPSPSTPEITSVYKNFDPSSWDGSGLEAGSTRFEAIPHTIVVEWHKESNKARFKAIENSTGNELTECPVPTCVVKSIDEENKVAKDDFDQIYQLEII